MTEYTATESNNAPARRTGVLSKLKARTANAMERHHQRMASLRIYPSTRLNNLSVNAEPATVAPDTEALATTAQDTGQKFSPLRRIANWFRAAYAAHEANLIELRVYGRKRD